MLTALGVRAATECLESLMEEAMSKISKNGRQSNSVPMLSWNSGKRAWASAVEVHVRVLLEKSRQAVRFVQYAEERWQPKLENMYKQDTGFEQKTCSRDTNGSSGRSVDLHDLNFRLVIRVVDAQQVLVTILFNNVVLIGILADFVLFFRP